MPRRPASDITCEVCNYAFSRAAWLENQGYCPNCDQPISRMAREALNLPRADLAEEEPTEPGPAEPAGPASPDQ